MFVFLIFHEAESKEISLSSKNNDVRNNSCFSYLYSEGKGFMSHLIDNQIRIGALQHPFIPLALKYLVLFINLYFRVRIGFSFNARN